MNETRKMVPPSVSPDSPLLGEVLAGFTSEYELKLASGKTVTWEGTSGEDAARRYVDCRPQDTVVATREAGRHGFYPGVDPRNIIG